MKNKSKAGKITVATVKYDCRHFRGHIPCAPNKLRGRICNSCDEYEKASMHILMIKLGAIGDVIRTTPLVTAFRKKHPGCRITWITHTPEVLPPDLVDDARRPDAFGLIPLMREKYDIAVNLDKDPEACMLLADVKSLKKFGFTWKNGHIHPATPAAGPKLLTGLFDRLSQDNTLNYLEEIFGICGLKFAGEEYLIRRDPAMEERWKSRVASHGGGKIVVGLNTGCGKRWTTRLWPDDYWIALIDRLKTAGYFPLLMGGRDEDELNGSFAKKTGAWYPGHFPLAEFISLSGSVDIVVTQVSMMMHIALALRKKMVLMNNIFNPNEFELYGRGVIVQPESGCDCYFGSVCTRTRRCMLDLGVGKVFHEVRALAGPGAVTGQ